MCDDDYCLSFSEVESLGSFDEITKPILSRMSDILKYDGPLPFPGESAEDYLKRISKNGESM